MRIGFRTRPITLVIYLRRLWSIEFWMFRRGFGYSRNDGAWMEIRHKPATNLP